MFFFKIIKHSPVWSGARALTLCCFLAAALLVLGCPMSGGGDGSTAGFVDDHKLSSKLPGTWNATNEGGDIYTITNNKLEYRYGGSINYGGTIRYVSNFSAAAGVIIIEYDEDKKQVYYEDGHYGDPNYKHNAPGNFLGIYYKELTDTSLQMGGAYKAGGAEETTLDNAKNKFTAGNEGTYMSFYGPYSKMQ